MTDQHTPTPAAAEHTPVVDDVAVTLGPWLDRLPADKRAEAVAARAAVVELAEEERIARELAAADAERETARGELHRGRAEQRWAMWCRQVPALYVDPRANPADRRPETFEHWLDRPTVQHAAQIAAWLRSKSPTLILVGDTGTYKTGTALAAGYAAAAAGVHVRYTSQLDHLRLLRPGGSDDPGRVRWNAARTSLLVLDDLGAETEIASEFVRQEVCALLDERLRENRRQIITTNVEDPPALAEMFGDRIVSRLMGGALVLPFEGGDRRLVPATW